MVYFLIFLFLLLVSATEIVTSDEKQKKALFFVSASLVLIFCSIRYGIGFDYYTYLYIYDQLPNTFSLNHDLSDIHGEYLFLSFFIYLKSLGVEYAYISSLTVLIINILFIRFIWKYSEYKCFSILILYSWYLVYIFSTLRQGLSMGIFLAFAFPYLLKKDYLKYSLVVIFAFFFHSSIIVFLLVPLFLKIFKLIEKNYWYIVACISVLIFIPNPILHQFAMSADRELYLDSSTNYLALANRIIAFFIVYLWAKPKEDEEALVLMRKLYFLGFLLYLLMAQSDTIASRFAALFKVFDIVLIPLVLRKLPHKYYPIFMVVMSVYFGFMLMNIVEAFAVLNETGITSSWEYPYITIFNQEDFTF